MNQRQNKYLVSSACPNERLKEEKKELKLSNL